MKTLEQYYYFYRKKKEKGGIRRKTAQLLWFFQNIIHSCEIPLETNIGKGVVFGHRGIGIVIHKDTCIADNVQIMQNVTIGAKNGKAPRIGNHVLIGAGAVLLGDVVIGDNVQIGANAVVLNDIPANCIAVGIPAKNIKSIQ